jgi:hypothetical protein
MVKLSGADAVLLSVRVICALFPGNAAKSTALSVLPGVVAARAGESQPKTSVLQINRNRIMARLP